MIDKVKANLATIIIIIAIISGSFGANAYFAKASEFKAFKSSIRMEKVQERIWQLEDRYKVGTDRPRPMPQSVKEELRELKAELEMLKAKLTGEK